MLATITQCPSSWPVANEHSLKESDMDCAPDKPARLTISWYLDFLLIVLVKLNRNYWDGNAVYCAQAAEDFYRTHVSDLWILVSFMMSTAEVFLDVHCQTFAAEMVALAFCTVKNPTSLGRNMAARYIWYLVQNLCALDTILFGLIF